MAMRVAHRPGAPTTTATSPKARDVVGTVDDDLPRVTCDPDAIREATANLLDNARRFAASSVTVEIRQGIGSVHVLVHDDGPGVAAAVADSLFDRFVSDDGGSGLGLPIAHGIVEAHGGRLHLDDGRFVMTLPVVGLDAA